VSGSLYCTGVELRQRSMEQVGLEWRERETGQRH